MYVNHHRDLRTYRIAFEAAKIIFLASKAFPPEEKFAMTDQVRRSSRSVCANLAEAFSRRNYPKYFVNKLKEAEGEASETQVWLEFALEFKYLDEDTYTQLITMYDDVIGKLITMARFPEQWKIN